MSSESVQNKLERVRKPRVHISYQVETEGALVEKELPFVVGVLGEFSGNSPGEAPKPLRDRKFVGIDRDNFNDIMKRVGPGVSTRVENTLSDDGSELAVQLKFKSMEDFEPANIVSQVEPLRKLLEARDKLRDLMTKVDRSEDLEGLLEQVLQNTEQMQQLQTALHLDPKSDAPNKEN
jgi:type VI secretion system protein ImpB